jgi:uncharacterized protein involved in type VI secretion and phage assembly
MPALVTIAVGGDAELLKLESLEIRHRVSTHGTLRARFRGERSGERIRQISAADLLGKDVEVRYGGKNGDTVLFSGLICRCRIGWTGGADATVGTLEAWTRSVKLSNTRRWRTFLDQDVRDIVSEVWPDLGFGQGVDASARPQVLQYGETDWDFLLRLCDRNSWFVTTHDPMVMGAFAGPTVTLAAGHVLDAYEVEVKLGAGGGKGLYQHVPNFSWEEPARPPSWPPNLGSPDGVADLTAQASEHEGWEVDLARLQDEAHDSSTALGASVERELFRANTRTLLGHGVSREPALAPGRKVDITGPARHAGTAGIVAVIHHFCASGEHAGYWNEFETTYHDSWFVLGAPTPAMAPGVAAAIVRANHDDQGLGRLKVSFGWQGSEITRWVRRMTPYAGPQRGMFFTPEVGEEVLVAFEDGDLERPVVIGALWSAKDPTDPLSRDAANDVKSIVSRVGNRIELHETGGEERVFIATPESRCTVTLTNGGGAAVEIYTKGRVSILAEEGEITVTAQQSNVSVTADKGDISVQASAGAMTLHAEKDLKITSNASISIGAEAGSISLSSQSLDIRAKKDIGIQGESASLDLDRLLEAKSGGDLNLTASSNARVNASMLDLNG